MSDVSFRALSFSCPLCGVHSQQSWYAAYDAATGNHLRWEDLYWATCLHCKQRTIWYKEKLVAPVATSAPPANAYMPPDIRVDYDEARDVAERSPRSAAGLLRLCAQRLCVTLGKPGKNLYTDIQSLVSDGLPVEIQDAFETLRLAGNSQLHPDDHGLDLRVEKDAATLLFTIVNMIVENRIAIPLRTKELHDRLKEGRTNSAALSKPTETA